VNPADARGSGWGQPGFVADVLAAIGERSK
jgi:hypothetical protein